MKENSLQHFQNKESHASPYTYKSRYNKHETPFKTFFLFISKHKNNKIKGNRLTMNIRHKTPNAMSSVASKLMKS